MTFFAKNWENLIPCLSGFLGKTALIVTDTAVAGLFLPDVAAVLSPHFAISTHIVPEGELSKNFAELEKLLTACFQAGLNRKSLLIALGGGMVGDLAGFAASIYMRGIQYINLPTTLLAQADSSIGGKTGVDFCGIKNLVGSFFKPAAVYANLATLAALPDIQYISGLAEVIKYGIIQDVDLFYSIWNKRNLLAKRDLDALEGALRTCCAIKTRITEQDERDTGLRQILNYGHTFGHAIESICDFGLPHGHCVALGMVCAAAYSHNEGAMSQENFDKICAILDFFSLPVKLPTEYRLSPRAILDMMHSDKKASKGDITLIISDVIGSAEIRPNADKAAILAAIETIL